MNAAPPPAATMPVAPSLLAQDHTLTVRARELRDLCAAVVKALPIDVAVVDRDHDCWPDARAIARADRRAVDAVFRTGRVCVREIVEDSPPGRRRVTLTPIRCMDDGVSHVMITSEDITSMRATQESARRAEQLAAVGQVAASVLHEIATPLATIGACVAGLAQPHRPRDTGGTVAVIENELERCAAIIGSVRDFSRPPTGARGPVTPEALIAESVMVLRLRGRELQVDVRTPITPPLPVLERANRIQLTQVLIALGLNAIDASHQGSVVTVAARGVRAMSAVEFSVADRGHGMTRDVLARVLDPFFTTKDAGRGTGLGLSVAHEIVTAHGGHLAIESAVAVGTTVRVTVPCT